MLAVDMGEVACDDTLAISRHKPRAPASLRRCLGLGCHPWPCAQAPGELPPPEALQAQLNQQAVHSSWTDLCYVPNEMKTEALIEKALGAIRLRDPAAPGPIITERLALLAVRKDGTSLQRIPEPLRTLQICSEAVLSDINAMQYVPDEIRQQLRRRSDRKGDPARAHLRGFSSASALTDCIFPVVLHGIAGVRGACLIRGSSTLWLSTIRTGKD